MGICEYSSDKNIVYTTKSLLDKVPGTKTTNFYFSTQPLVRLDSDCLVILSKDYNSIKNNKFIKNISNKTNMNKICKDFDNARGNRTLRFGDFIMFNSFVTGLEFNKFAVICISENEYQQIQQNQQNNSSKNMLKQKLNKIIEDIKSDGVTSLAITEFQWKSWLSKLSIFKLISKIIIENRLFKSVVFACLNQDTQALYMKTVQQIKQQQLKQN